MFRLLVALYLMIVAAVGPATCCCTFTRLMYRYTQAPSSPDEQPPSCCQHGPRSQPSAEIPEQHSPGCPDSPGCPCKQAGACSAVALPAGHDEAREVSLRGALVEFFCESGFSSSSFTPPASASPVFRESSVLGPSVTTDELLYAFHMLRC
jgi:hypothetical protein